jgi:hypothetical protein
MRETSRSVFVHATYGQAQACDNELDAVHRAGVALSIDL